MNSQTPPKIKLITFKNQKEFDQVNRLGQKIVGKYLIVVSQLAHQSEFIFQPTVYLGLKVSRKIGGAVIRNKIRRRFKHMVGNFVKSNSKAYNNSRFLIIPKRQIADVDYSHLAADFAICCNKALIASK